jgi:hypothetical protein
MSVLATSVDDLRGGLALFVITALTLLTVFIAILLVILRRRRARVASLQHGDEAELPDAWAEAARRAEPFEKRK